MKFFSLAVASLASSALGLKKTDSANIVFEKQEGSLSLSENNKTIEILLDSGDFPGVHIAAQSLSDDFEKVTGTKAPLSNNTASQTYAIIAGTIGKSKFINNLASNKTINVDSIKGKWESYQTQLVDNPCSGVDKALVIAGSDKRGTIYGIYDISEQIGVSPLHYIADVPAKKHDKIFALNVLKQKGEPSVQYRGIFINDESPCLFTNLQEKFGLTKYDSPFVSEFYVHVFEMLLRLKANTLWPASWNSMFNWDDRRNQPLADTYGIVASTSHTEPLNMGSDEWIWFGNGTYDYVDNKKNVHDFWEKGVQNAAPYEGFYQMGMRGIGDAGIAHGSKELLEEIVDDQKKMMKKHINDNVTAIPKMWSLYKEVMQYYNEGMEVPDDVTLLWSDDNFGNMRRLPIKNESDRASGSGIYYHFEYVGVPRSYKWLNTIQLEQSWEQLHMAYHRNAKKIWILNVGDIKPLEMPMSWFMDIAYDFDKWGQINMVNDWYKQWATKTFSSKFGSEIGDIADLYGKYAARKKFEQIQPETFSVSNYQEADRILKEWRHLEKKAQNIYDNLDKYTQVAYFEMILHPIKAGRIMHEIHIATGKNHTYRAQLRNVVNQLVDEVRKWFKEDHKLKMDYHGLLDGKWDHIMEQTHLGFTWWQQEYRNSLPPLYFTQELESSIAGTMGITIENNNASIPGDDDLNNGPKHNIVILPETNPYSQGKRFFEIYSRGLGDFDFNVQIDNEAVTANPSKGSFKTNDTTAQDYSTIIELDIDWSKIKNDSTLVQINVTSPQTPTEAYMAPTYDPIRQYPLIQLPLNKTEVPDNFTGFVETGGYISIEPEHAIRNTSNDKVEYKVMKNYGRHLSGVTLFPVTCDSQKPDDDDSPRLEYDFYTFKPSNVTLFTYLSPTLNHYPERPGKYAVSFDDEEPEVVQLTQDPDNAEDMPEGWSDAVTDNIWKKNSTHTLESGKHTLKLWALEPGVVFQHVLLDLDRGASGLQESYLGPPESPFVEGKKEK